MNSKPTSTATYLFSQARALEPNRTTAIRRYLKLNKYFMKKKQLQN